MQKKIFGYKILERSGVKHFNVCLKQRFVEFDPEWKKLLTENEITFCARWAKVAARKKTVDLSEIDRAVMSWYVSTYGRDALDSFLSKITDPNLYHRLVYGSLVNNAKKTPWQKLKNFLSKKK